MQREGESRTLEIVGKDVDETTRTLKKQQYGWKIGDMAQTGITSPSLDYLNTCSNQKRLRSRT